MNEIEVLTVPDERIVTDWSESGDQFAVTREDGGGVGIEDGDLVLRYADCQHVISAQWLPALARHPAIRSLALENVERLCEDWNNEAEAFQSDGGLFTVGSAARKLRAAIEADRERQGENDG